MIDFVRYRKWFYLLTAILLMGTVAALVLPPRIPWGLEFSSGTSLTLKFVDPPDDLTSQDVRSQLLALGLADAVVQGTGNGGYFVRTESVEDDLLPFLELTFGPVQSSDFEGASDVATFLSFIDPVSEQELRDAFGENVQGLVISQVGDGSLFISVEGLAQPELATLIDTFEDMFGPAESIAFGGTADLAVTLDFGLEATLEELQQEVDQVADGLVVVLTETNLFVVGGAEVSAEAKEALVPALEARFGRSKKASYDSSENMALQISSDDPIDAVDVQNEVRFQGSSDVTVLELGDNSFILVGENVEQERQDTLLTAIEDRFDNIQSEPFDFDAGDVFALDFGEAVDIETLRTEVARLESAAFIIPSGDNDFFIAGKDIAQDDRETLLTALEDVFGLADRTPFDFDNGAALTLRFTDPVSLTDVVDSLAVIPIREVLAGRAEVQLIGPGTFRVIGVSLGPETQESILAGIDQRVGETQKDRLDQDADDLAIALDFGPGFTRTDLVIQVNSLDPNAEAESLGDGVFFIGGDDMDEDTREAVLEAVEAEFGPARRVSLDAPEHMALIVVFEPGITVNDLRTEVTNQVENEGLPSVVVTLSRAGLFVGGTDVTQEEQDAYLAAFEGLSDSVETQPFDFSAGTALTLDFGETVNEEQLKAELVELGFNEIRLVTLVGPGIFMGAHDISAARQEELLTALEDRFGLAQQTSFHDPEFMAVTISLEDPVRAAEAVSESLIVQKAGPNSFFLAANDQPLEAQIQIFSTLESTFGTIFQSDYNFAKNLALTVTFTQPLSAESIRLPLEDRGYQDLVIEQRGESTYFLRGKRPPADQKGKIISSLEAAFGPIDPESLEFSFVDAEIARRSVVNTFIAVIAGSVGILIYVWWAFRRTPKPFRFGVAAVVGLGHDAALVLGAFGLMAKFRGVEIDSLMIVGILAVIGYSVNNTIVVMDRIRENLIRNPGRDFDTAVNFSLNETLSRNVNTALTTALAVLAVLLFGGPTIFNFMLVLLIGVLAGAYSSLFLAANILVSWEKGEIRRTLFPFLRRDATAPR